MHRGLPTRRTRVARPTHRHQQQQENGNGSSPAPSPATASSSTLINVDHLVVVVDADADVGVDKGVSGISSVVFPGVGVGNGGGEEGGEYRMSSNNNNNDDDGDGDEDKGGSRNRRRRRGSALGSSVVSVLSDETMIRTPNAIVPLGGDEEQDQPPPPSQQQQQQQQQHHHQRPIPPPIQTIPPPSALSHPHPHPYPYPYSGVYPHALATGLATGTLTAGVPTATTPALSARGFVQPHYSHLPRRRVGRKERGVRVEKGGKSEPSSPLVDAGGGGEVLTGKEGGGEEGGGEEGGGEEGGGEEGGGEEGKMQEEEEEEEEVVHPMKHEFMQKWERRTVEKEGKGEGLVSFFLRREDEDEDEEGEGRGLMSAPLPMTTLRMEQTTAMRPVLGMGLPRRMPKTPKTAGMGGTGTPGSADPRSRFSSSSSSGSGSRRKQRATKMQSAGMSMSSLGAVLGVDRDRGSDRDEEEGEGRQGRSMSRNQSRGRIMMATKGKGKDKSIHYGDRARSMGPVRTPVQRSALRFEFEGGEEEEDGALALERAGGGSSSAVRLRVSVGSGHGAREKEKEIEQERRGVSLPRFHHRAFAHPDYGNPSSSGLGLVSSRGTPLWRGGGGLFGSGANVGEGEKKRKRGGMCLQNVDTFLGFNLEGVEVEVGFAREDTESVFWGLSEEDGEDVKREMVLTLIDDDEEMSLVIPLPTDLSAYREGVSVLESEQMREAWVFVREAKRKRRVRILVPRARAEDGMALALGICVQLDSCSNLVVDDEELQASSSSSQQLSSSALHTTSLPSLPHADPITSPNASTKTNILHPLVDDLSEDAKYTPVHRAWMRMMDEQEHVDDDDDDDKGGDDEDQVDVVGIDSTSSSSSDEVKQPREHAKNERPQQHPLVAAKGGVRPEWRGVFSYEGLMGVWEMCGKCQ